MKQERIKGLDGIRIWAILLIVASHTGLLVGDGPVGVALCFVLSGFLAVYASKEDPTDGFLSPKKWIRYYVCRFFRIIPLYYCCIFFFWFFYPTICFGSWQSVINHLIFKECGVHFWYLQQEVVMYLLVPPILFVFALVKKVFRNAEWIEFLFIGALLFAAWFTKSHVLFTLYGNGGDQPFRIYLFLMGMATAYFCRFLKKKDCNRFRTEHPHVVKILIVVANLWILMALLLTALSAIITFRLYGNYDIPLDDVTYGVIAMVWVIAAVFCYKGPIVAFIGNPLFVHLSGRSYGIYLFHFLLRLSLGVPDGIPMFLLDTFMSICVAEVLYALIEKPLGDFGRHLSAKKLGLYYKELFSK